MTWLSLSSSSTLPWYGVLLVAILAMSWGGPLFALIVPTPAMLKAGHRLVVTTIMMVPGFYSNWRKADSQLRSRWWGMRYVLFLNGIVIGAHFCAFSYSVNHTTLSNALLICSVTPVLLVIWAMLLWVVGRFLLQLYGDAIRISVSNDTFGTPVIADVAAPDSSASTSDGDSTDSAAATRLQAMIGAVSDAPMQGPAGLPQGPASDERTTEAELQPAHADRPVVDEESLALRTAWDATQPVGTGQHHLHLYAPLGYSGAAGFMKHSPSSFGLASPPETATSISSSGNASALAPTVGGSGGQQQSPAAHWSLRAMTALTGLAARDAMHPPFPTIQEIVGSAVAFAGVAYLAMARQAESEASGSPLIRAHGLDGDFASFITAVFMAIYLIVGGRLRAWMPLWMYVLPVTGIGAVTACVASLIFEGMVWPTSPPVTAAGFSPYSLFGWLGSGTAFGLSVAIAFVPGIMGHTLANLSLARISPLILSVAQLAQPAISAACGYAVGVQGKPSTATIVAAPIIAVGIALVITGSRKAAEAGFSIPALVRRCTSGSGDLLKGSNSDGA